MKYLVNLGHSSSIGLPGLLELEHGLVMLLLLYGMLTYRGPRFSRYVPWIILVGIALSIATPFHEIDLIWPLISGVIVPPLLWQSAIAVTRGGQLRSLWSMVVWGTILVMLMFALHSLSGLPFSNALLLSILAVTLVWYLRELNVERTFLSTIGQVTLAVLLVEVDLQVVSLREWVGTLVTGIFLGLVVGFLGIVLYRRLKRKGIKDWFFLGLAYASYLLGVWFGISPIAVTFAAGLVVAVYGFSIGLWLRADNIPMPADLPSFFFVSAALWLLLGWQAHTGIEVATLPGILAALAVIALGFYVIRKIVPLQTEESIWHRLLRKETKVLILLFGSILFWPPQAQLSTLSVDIALAAALLLIIFLRELIKPIFEMIGVELSWPTDHGSE